MRHPWTVLMAFCLGSMAGCAAPVGDVSDGVEAGGVFKGEGPDGTERHCMNPRMTPVGNATVPVAICHDKPATELRPGQTIQARLEQPPIGGLWIGCTQWGGAATPSKLLGRVYKVPVSDGTRIVARLVPLSPIGEPFSGVLELFGKWPVGATEYQPGPTPEPPEQDSSSSWRITSFTNDDFLPGPDGLTVAVDIRLDGSRPYVTRAKDGTPPIIGLRVRPKELCGSGSAFDYQLSVTETPLDPPPPAAN